MASAIQSNPYVQPHYQLAGTTPRSIAAVLNKLASAAGGAQFVKTLDITGITREAIDRLPDLSAFVNVETVILSENNFERIPEEVIRLPKVSKLVLDHCPNLSTLAGVEHMGALKEIEAEGCSFMEWPIELMMTQVEKINLLGSNIFDIPLLFCPLALKQVWISGFNQLCPESGQFTHGGLPADHEFMSSFKEDVAYIDGETTICYTKKEGLAEPDMGTLSMDLDEMMAEFSSSSASPLGWSASEDDSMGELDDVVIKAFGFLDQRV